MDHEKLYESEVDNMIRVIAETQATFALEMARASDMYRISHLLATHAIKIQALAMQAEALVNELEEM